MNSIGSSPAMGSPQTNKPFKRKAHGLVHGTSPTRRGGKNIDLTSNEHILTLDKLEKDLQKVVEQTEQDGSSQEEGVKKLIVANQQFLTRVKTLQNAISEKMKEIGQGPSSLTTSTMSGNNTLGIKDKTPDLIRKLISLNLDANLYFFAIEADETIRKLQNKIARQKKE